MARTASPSVGVRVGPSHAARRAARSKMFGDQPRLRERVRDAYRAGAVVGSLAGPQRFDESGFPIPQPRMSFSERVRRLLSG